MFNVSNWFEKTTKVCDDIVNLDAQFVRSGYTYHGFSRLWIPCFAYPLQLTKKFICIKPAVTTICRSGQSNLFDYHAEWNSVYRSSLPCFVVRRCTKKPTKLQKKAQKVLLRTEFCYMFLTRYGKRGELVSHYLFERAVIPRVLNMGLFCAASRTFLCFCTHTRVLHICDHSTRPTTKAV